MKKKRNERERQAYYDGFLDGLRAQFMNAPDHIVIEELIRRDIVVAAIRKNQKEIKEHGKDESRSKDQGVEA